MEQKGFSLIELVIVIAIAAILMSIATFQFKRWHDKSQIESQVNTLYSDLSDARMKSLYEKDDGRSVRITSSVFSVYTSTVDKDNTTTDPYSRKSMKVTMTTNPANLQIDFSPSGIATINGDDSTQYAEICLDQKGTDAAYDSLLISKTNIQMGKLTATGCSRENFSPQ